MATPEGETTPNFQPSTRKLSFGTSPKESHQKELVKVTLQRDEYKSYCKEKDRLIQEYHEALAEKETKLMCQSSVIEDLEKQLAAYGDAGDGASANNSLSEEDKMRRELEVQATRVKELEVQVARVRDLEEMIGTVEKDKREAVAVLEIQMKDKDEEIQMLMGQAQNDALLSVELRKLLEINEKQLADTKKSIQELENDLSNKVVEIEDLSDALTEKEREIIRLTEKNNKVTEIAAEEKKQTVRQLKGQLDELLKKNKTQERQMADLFEKIQLKEAENAVYKQDFETERNDRQRIHAQYEELKTKTEEARQQHKADKDAMAQLAEKKQECEESIQTLTAQVNAYSREVDKQKGLVTQSQEKHKTEVSELNEKLANEIQSKQQLDGELARMRQQLANVSANKEELLTAYNKEQAAVTRLEYEVEKIKQANKVLVDKLKGHDASTASSQAHISSRRNDVPGGNYYQMSAQASSGSGVEEEEGDEMEHSNRAYSDHLNEKPQFTAEEMAALFKKPAQPAYYEMELGYDEHEAEKEKKRIDKELEEIDQFRQQNSLSSSPKPRTRYAHQDPSQPSQERSDEVIQDSKATVDDGRPLDPNLVCPKCGKQYREGQIQKLRRHINDRCSNEDSNESHKETDKDEEEIQQMAEKGRKEMQGPSTAEVLFNDDDNNSLPYDPNLVCPKCGKQYRVGEIQKLRRHINEFCTGIR